MVKLGRYFNRQKAPSVRTPSVLQMEAVECGAACLGMILAHFGRWVPLTQLRADCGVSRDGSKASNLIRAARLHGMVAKGFKKDIAQLRRMKLPFVIFWNFNHYIVVEGFFRKRIRLNDPGQGRRYVSYEEFDESFTGVVLTFEPDAGFTRQGTEPSILRSLHQRMQGTRSPLLFLFLTSLLAVLPSLLNAGYPRIFLDHVVRDELWDWLQPLLAAMSCTLAFMVVLEMLYGRMALRLQAKLAVAQSAKYMWHVLRLPVEFFALRLGIEVAARAAANDAIAFLIASQLSTGVLNVLMAAFYAAVMLRYDILLTVFGIVLAAVNLGLVHWISRRKVELGRTLLMARGGLVGYTILSIQNIETIKAAGTESDCFSIWAGYQARVMSLEQRLESSCLGLSAVPELLSALNAAALLCLGGYRVMQGVMSIGMFITFQALMLSFMTPLSSVLTLGVDVQALRYGMTRLDDVTDNAIDPMLASLQVVDGPGKVHAGKLRGDLELRDVVFGYSQLESPLLAGISLKLRPGMRIGVVGGSGSGKSTVARLVAGTHRAWSGEILFDGVRREEIDRQLLCGSIALVDQDVVLFEGTIRDNIALWDESMDDAVIVQAARDAGIHDFITTLEDDYGHLLHDGGRNLSGGQRQRIEIARALLQDPSLLVMDEATSALDTLSEKHVMDAIARRGCACLVIAHRLSTIRDCDEILVLERGHIVQRGTHRQLAEHPGPYATLLALEPMAMETATV